MSDIVERLLRPGSTIEEREAAAEIERLRAALRTILNYLDEDEEPVWYNIARRALDDD